MTNVNVHDELVYYIRDHVIPDAYALLPARMMSREATAMLLAIGLQESAFRARRQSGNGPARGFWQFERAGGVKEILNHSVTGPIIKPIAEMLLYHASSDICHAAIEHHDVLAVCFARLLLWVDPRTLPQMSNPAMGWSIYLANWRPGKPHYSSWNSNFLTAWSIVNGTTT